jgi:hypothetical protein
MRQRSLSVVVVSATLAAGALAGAPASASSATAAKAPHSRPLIQLIAGSPIALVYAVGHVAGRGKHIHATGSERLFVRTPGGTTEELGTLPPHVDPQSASVVGSILSMPTTNGAVRWLDFKGNSTGRINLGKHETYVTGAPDGFIAAKRHRHLVDVSTTGKATKFGTPFPSSRCINGAADAATFLFAGCRPGKLTNSTGPSDNNTPVATTTSSDPTDYDQLNSGTLAHLRCSSVDASYAGCYSSGGGNQSPMVELIPLGLKVANHSLATIETLAKAPNDPVSLADSTVIWQTATGLSSLVAGQHVVTSGSPELRPARALKVAGSDPDKRLHSSPRATVSALGGVAVVSHSGESVYLASSATSAARLFSAPGEGD